MIIEIENFLSNSKCEGLINKYVDKVTPISSGERIDRDGNLVVQDIRDNHRKTDWFVFNDKPLRDKILNALVLNSNLLLETIKKEELFQFLRYKETGHFTWHHDLTESKEYMTAILLLNDTFAGGDLLYKQNKEIINFKRTAGTLLLFPATLQHKVSEITKGTRYSIVTWIYKKPNLIF